MGSLNLSITYANLNSAGDKRPPLFGRTAAPNGRKRKSMPSPRTQNPIQYWQLRQRLSVEQAALRLGLSPARYRAVVIFGMERLSDVELLQFHTVTGIRVEVLRAWQERPRGDTRNPPAR